MGFWKNLGGKAVDELKDWSEEANEYYEEAKTLDDEEFREELKRAKRGSNMAKLVGYNKAAKER